MSHWLGLKLEPGEHVVLCEPPVSKSWYMAGLCFAFPVMLPFWLRFLGGLFHFSVSEEWNLPTITTVVAAVFAPVFFVHYRWKLKITDRRVIFRNGLARLGLNQILRDEIEYARMDGSMFTIGGGGREFRIPCAGIIAATPMLKALGQTEETAT